MLQTFYCTYECLFTASSPSPIDIPWALCSARWQFLTRLLWQWLFRKHYDQALSRILNFQNFQSSAPDLTRGLTLPPKAPAGKVSTPFKKRALSSNPILPFIVWEDAVADALRNSWHWADACIGQPIFMDKNYKEMCCSCIPLPFFMALDRVQSNAHCHNLVMRVTLYCILLFFYIKCHCKRIHVDVFLIVDARRSCSPLEGPAQFELELQRSDFVNRNGSFVVDTPGEVWEKFHVTQARGQSMLD